MNPRRHDPLLRRALEEDLGLAGDLTSAAIFDQEHASTARIVTREEATVAGLPVAGRVFQLLDPQVDVDLRVEDGATVALGTVLAEVSGPTRAILGAERTALNLLGRLSGIATATMAAVTAVAGTGCRIADTRKTTPTLRALEKYAVRMGGGSNHRFGLHDAVMIKDNHVVAAGGIRPALERVHARVGHTVTVEVEVDTLEQLHEVVEVGADVVLLDNMTLEELRKAVAIVHNAPERIVTEASGGIGIDRVREFAETGVDVISLGTLTHTVTNIDISLDFDSA